MNDMLSDSTINSPGWKIIDKETFSEGSFNYTKFTIGNPKGKKDDYWFAYPLFRVELKE